MCNQRGWVSTTRGLVLAVISAIASPVSAETVMRKEISSYAVAPSAQTLQSLPLLGSKPFRRITQAVGSSLQLGFKEGFFTQKSVLTTQVNDPLGDHALSTKDACRVTLSIDLDGKTRLERPAGIDDVLVRFVAMHEQTHCDVDLLATYANMVVPELPAQTQSLAYGLIAEMSTDSGSKSLISFDEALADTNAAVVLLRTTKNQLSAIDVISRVSALRSASEQDSADGQVFDGHHGGLGLLLVLDAQRRQPLSKLTPAQARKLAVQSALLGVLYARPADRRAVAELFPTAATLIEHRNPSDSILNTAATLPTLMTVDMNNRDFSLSRVSPDVAVTRWRANAVLVLPR